MKLQLSAQTSPSPANFDAFAPPGAAKFPSIRPRRDTSLASVSLDAWLAQFVSAQGGVAGTVHKREGDLLTLAASLNIPPPVVEKTRVIPRGKGMAGLAWERDDIVATCNLKTDQTGDVRPGAKAVNAQGAVAIPVHDAAGALRAVVGVAFAQDRDFGADELAAFARAAEALPSDA
jgi:L-methionine (R)-S-oxide reductase